MSTPAAISGILAVCVCCGTDIMPAISLAYEKAENDIMKRKPRNPVVDKLVNVKLVCFGYFVLGVISTLSGMFVYYVSFGYYGYAPWAITGFGNCWTTSDKIILFQDSQGMYVETTATDRQEALNHVNTCYFASIVICQWGTLLCVKTRRNSIFQQGFRNYVLDVAIVFAGALCCFIVYAPFINSIFSSAPIRGVFWLLPLPFFLFMVTFDETRKFLMRQDNVIGRFIEEFTYY